MPSSAIALVYVNGPSKRIIIVIIIILGMRVEIYVIVPISRSQWPRGLRRGSAAARLLGLWVWIPPGSWMSVSCECCVMTGRGLCVGLITRPEESCRLWCFWVRSWNLDDEKALAHCGLLRHWKIIVPMNVTSGSSTACTCLAHGCYTVAMLV